MKSNPLPLSNRRALSHFPTRSSVTSSSLLVVGLVAYVVPACAQNVLTAPPPINTTPPALQEFRASQSGEPLPQGEEGPAVISIWRPPWQVGPLTLRPHFGASYSYINGLLESPGQPTSTTTFAFSPGLLFVFGSHWTLDYTPTLRWYSNNGFRNELDQSVSLNGWAAYEDWILSLSQGFSDSSAPTVQTGTQTQETTFSTALGASHRLNSQVSVDLGLNQIYQSSQEFQSYHQWSTMDWVNYQFWPRFNAGLGLGGGYADVQTGSDMASEDFQGRINWRATDKTSIILNGGLDYRQFLSGGVAPLVSPIYGLAIQSHPLQATTVSLLANRTVGASYFANQASETSQVGLNVSQGLAKKLSLSLGGSYSHVTYVSTAVGVPAQGAYNYAYFTARLTYAVIKRGTISATYQLSHNISNQPGLSYTSNEIGVELAYSF